MIRWIGRDGKSSARDGVAKADKTAKKTAVHKAATDDRRRQMPLKMPVLDLTPVISHILCRSVGRRRRQFGPRATARQNVCTAPAWGPQPRGPIPSGGPITR